MESDAPQETTAGPEVRNPETIFQYLTLHYPFVHLDKYMIF